MIGDTTGYGVAAVKASVRGLKKDGAEVVYQANIDATQPDMTPDMLRAKNAGAQAIVVWSTSTGMDARLFNTRAAMSWDVPFVGHPSMSSGDVAKLSTSRRTGRRSTPSAIEAAATTTTASCRRASEELVARLKGKVDLSDTLLWWVAGGVDAINLIAKAVEETGSTESADIIKYWNSVKNYPGYFGEYTYSPTEHNGYPARRCRDVRRQLGAKTAPSSSRPATRADVSRIASRCSLRSSPRVSRWARSTRSSA